jgi:quercetin dioxygenase-like cupin family protein
MAQKSQPQGPEDVAELVAYQRGSVVSREIIRKQSGTVTVFAFDEGQGLSEHVAPFDALLLGLDGEAEITVAGKASVVASGKMIILPAGKPHAIRASKKFKMMLVMIRSEK